MWFSPDGRYLLYAAFDDRDVSTYDITIYGDMTEAYVRSTYLAYPKVKS